MIDDMAVYIANLGKYNEGYLVGAWFTFPIDEEDVKEKIGLNEQYEEYAIHDTDNFPIAIGEYVSIEELNEMYEMIEELPDYRKEHTDPCRRYREWLREYGILCRFSITDNFNHWYLYCLYGTDKKRNQQSGSSGYQFSCGVRIVRFIYCLRSRLHQEDK